jgi:hypothetical protein
MIKDTIFNLQYEIDGKARIDKSKNSCLITGDELINLKIEIPEKTLFFWPNREGELIESKNINNVLYKNNISFASICYPATASMLFFIIYNQIKNEGTILYSNPDIDGKIAIFSLNKGLKDPYLQIKSVGIELKILRKEGSTLKAIVDAFIEENEYSSILPSRTKLSNYQVQLGFYDPYGKHNVPISKGFGICEDIAKLMKTNIGEDNIIHMFAYHGTHDSNYPDYSPAQELGGPEGLKKAIASIHKAKQKCSLYMNARLFSKVLLEKYPYLKDSIVINLKGNRVIETYYERDFYVMDPLSEDWRSLLIDKALSLKSLGADIIQLDQVAGRAAIGPIGCKWGHGYRLLIKNIEDLGLEVWIQGINEIYPANRFELCFRYPNILSDGTVRGGHPFGVSYPIIPRLLNNQNYIIPRGSKNLLKDINSKNVTIDLEHLPGELSIYSQQYMQNLTNIVKEIT